MQKKKSLLSHNQSKNVLMQDWEHGASAQINDLKNKLRTEQIKGVNHNKKCTKW
jgi:hypothetical protein